MKPQSGFSLVEALVSVAIVGIVALAFAAVTTQNLKSAAYIDFLGKKELLRQALTNSILNKPINCKCLFNPTGGTVFPATGVTSLTYSATISNLGVYNFTTPGDRTTATVPSPLISSTGIDGLKLNSTNISNIISNSGDYSGTLEVDVEALNEVLGPKQHKIKIPVNIGTIPSSAGNVEFMGCAIQPMANPGPFVVHAAGKAHPTGSGNAVCTSISFPPVANNNDIYLSGNMFYPGGPGGWGGWTINFQNINGPAGTANACMDSSGGYSGVVGAEWINWVLTTPTSTASSASAYQIVGSGKVNMGGSGNRVCKGISFQGVADPTKLYLTGNMFYPGGPGGWGGWTVTFDSINALAGNATVCIDSSGGYSGVTGAEWVAWQATYGP